MSSDGYYELICSACGAREVIGPLQMLERLSAARLLKPTNEPDWEIVCELFRSCANVRLCVQCGSGAVALEPYVDVQDDDWGEVRGCERCGATIPPERLEVFPDTRLCVACQGQRDRGAEEGEPEYCPRCGAIMRLQLSRAAGLSRYVMRCDACRR
jgi:hypothetical protein